MKCRSISRIFQRSHHHKQSNHHQTISIITSTTTTSYHHIHSNALSKQDKDKLLSLHKNTAKSEYERACAIRSKQYKKLQKDLDDEKPEHHQVFSRVFYKPNFPEKYEPTDLSQCDYRPMRQPKPFNMQRTGVIAKKVGMTTMFDSKGVHHPITILKLDAVQVIQHKGVQNPKKGTFNQQLGYGTALIRNTKWRELGTFNAHKVSPKEKLMEFQCGHNALIKPGTEISSRHFLVGQYVDIQGVSKDKGFQGVMKRWGFKGGPATHGSSKFHRRRGAMGGSSDPGKVWKGKRMPGHMGNNNYTQRNLRIFRIEPKNNLIYVIGPVAGYKDSFVRIRDCHFLPPKKPPFPTFIPDPNETELPDGEQWEGDLKNYLWNRDPNMDDWKDDRVTRDLL